MLQKLVFENVYFLLYDKANFRLYSTIINTVKRRRRKKANKTDWRLKQMAS